MFLPQKFYIYKENDLYIELREKKLKLYFCCAFLILVGLILVKFLFFDNLTDCTMHSARYVIASIGAGGFPIILGVIPMLTIGRISIDRQKKELKYYAGIRKFLFSSINISFSEISHIEIIINTCVNGFRDVDKIILKLKGLKPIAIDFSWDNTYTNEITYKISQFVGCGVHQSSLSN